MSQVRANSITNAAGTGAPDLPNGATFPSTAGASTFAGLMGYTTTATTGGTTFLTNTSSQCQVFTGTSTETVRMPDTSTLATGWTFQIFNYSSNSLFIRASSASGSLIQVLQPFATMTVTCISTAVTDSTAWVYAYDGFVSVTGTGSAVLSASPTLTGTPLAPTAAAGTNTTQIATTAFVTEAAIPAGSVVQFARNSAPTGWLKANGAAVSRTTYATLFSVIGTTFGVGDGSTTFNLPDLRGYFSRNWDDGRGIDSGRSFGSLQATRVNNVQTVTIVASPGYATPITIDDNGTTSTGAYTGGFTGGDRGLTFAKKGGDTYPGNIALLACIKF